MTMLPKWKFGSGASKRHFCGWLGVSVGEVPEECTGEKTLAVDRAAISVSCDMTFLQAARQLNAVVRPRRRSSWYRIYLMTCWCTSANTRRLCLPPLDMARWN